MENRRLPGPASQNAPSAMHDQESPTIPSAIIYDQDSPPTAGPFQYYEPPASKSSGEKRRSFSERTGDAQQKDALDGVVRSDSRKARDLGITGHLAEPFDETEPYSFHDTAAEKPTRIQRVKQGSAAQQPLRIDPNAVPSNLRSKAWSPELTSPRVRPRQQQVNDVPDTSRRGSVSDRSPLQQLEADLFSKEQKRARVERAEERVRQSSLGTNHLSPSINTSIPRNSRSDKTRAVSEGDQRLSEQPRRTDEKTRHVSSGSTADGANRGERRIHRMPASPTDTRSRAQEENYPSSHERQDAPDIVQPKSYRQSSTSSRVIDESQDMKSPIKSQQREFGRTASGKNYKRDAVAIGAGAALSGAAMKGLTAAERGKIAHERRKSQLVDSSHASPITPTSPGDFARSESKKFPRRQAPPSGFNGKDEPIASGGSYGQPLRSHPVVSDDKANVKNSDPIQEQTREDVATAKDNPINYRIPPQTASGQQTRQQVAFATEPLPTAGQKQGKQSRLGEMFHRHGEAPRSYQQNEKPLEEWRNAEIARLTAQDLDFDPQATSGTVTDRNDPWWVKNKRRSVSGGEAQGPRPAPYDGPYEEEAKQYKPILFTKCGPLLRYTGMRKEAALPSRNGTSGSPEREIWRGSVMIVTDDAMSDYSTVPTLRIFAQPMELLTPPPQHLIDSGMELPPEYEDPVAGQVKLSRTGRPIYVRPVHDIDGEVDLSRIEKPDGLYAATRTPVLGPQSTKGADGRPTQHIAFQDKSRIKGRDGEKARRFREVKASRLHVERNVTFWRFNLEIELGATQQRVAYRINKGPAIGFWVPARDQSMNIMFHSCNGFSMAVDPDSFSGPDPLWRDVLNQHQSRPFHVMLGGGDQVYNDAAMRDATLFREWLQIKNPEHKHHADFTTEMQAELESFYLDRYAMWFSQGLFAMANSQIPMVNIWDDHDIIDGYGSYPHHFMCSPVFTGLGNIAFKYYMLFQHQSTVAETQREEPSWLLGASRGPYINELSRSVFMRLGRTVSLVGVDCRTERMRDEILSEESYDLIFERCRSEIVKGETKHLIVLLGVPIAYPRLNFLENILTSRVMDPIKALGRTGMLGGFVNKFDGGVEILDDLDDHWTAKHHKSERNWFVQELQELAAERSVRITILGGDVHLGAVGQFYTPKRFGLAKHKDHRYMPNVVSSAIVNTPPPTMMADVLNKRNKVHHLDDETDEDLIPMFDKDVDGSRRNNNHLLPRRNYCTIREYVPGSTPPPSPRLEPVRSATMPTDGDAMGGALEGDERMGRDRRFPPGSMKRTMSLTRGPMSLVRRLSGSKGGRNASISGSRPSSQQEIGPSPALGGQMRRSASLSIARPGPQFNPDSDDPLQRPSFIRRPTNLSIKAARKAAAKGGAEGNLDGHESGHVNLEHGLDISLNMEIDQKDPGGSTVPYRLLVPALWYEGEGDLNTLDFKGKKVGLLQRLRSGRQRRGHEVGEDGRSRSPSPSPSPPPTAGHDQYASNFTGPGSHATTNLVPNRTTRLDDEQEDTPRSSAHKRGFGLFPPPIGANTEQSPPNAAQQPVSPVGNNPYPLSGYRRTSGPDPPAQAHGAPVRGQPQRGQQQGYDGAGSEGSLTPSEGSFSEASPRPQHAQPNVRRPSKAAQFFGVGDGDRLPNQNEQMPVQQGGDDGNGNGKRKKSWQIWKS